MVLSDRVLTLALERAGLQAPVRFEEVTPSTQAMALAMAAEGAPEWTLVGAGHQTQGRGRLGRTWIDEPGAGLLFSLVLRPTFEPRYAGLLVLLAGWALAGVTAEASGAPVRCTWPNDLVVGDRKIGGILAESRLHGSGRFEGVVLGVGLNVGGAPEQVEAAGAVAIADPAELLGDFLTRLRSFYEPDLPSRAGELVAAYRAICATLGLPVRARTTAGVVVEGTATDVDDGGALVVESGGERTRVAFGEIQHLGVQGLE